MSMAPLETAAAYAARLASYVEGQDPIAMQRRAPQTLAALIRGVSIEKLTTRPAVDRWSVTEIVAHLAEDELTSSWRYRQMIEHNGTTLMGFDQDLWAKLGDYGSWEPNEALSLFGLLRGANLRMFDRLSPEQWNASGTHAERGRITVRELARHMAAHDINHIKQIENILGR
jgi:DinB superfamily